MKKDITQRRGDAKKKRRRSKEYEQQLCAAYRRYDAPLREVFGN
jgi:hypothetical protein